MKKYRKPNTIDFYIRSISRELQYGIDERLTNYDITRPQGKLLGMIYAANKQGFEITRKYLQDKTGISGPSVTSLLDTLEKKGYIERTVNSEDARALNVKATKEGESLVNEIHGIFRETEKELLSGMTSEETKKLKELLKKAYSNVAEK